MKIKRSPPPAAKASSDDASAKRKADSELDRPAPKKGRASNRGTSPKAKAPPAANTASTKTTLASRPKPVPASKEKSTLSSVTTDPPKKRKSTAGASTRPAQKVKTLPAINKIPNEPLDIYVCGEGSAGELGLGSKGNVLDVSRPRLNTNLDATSVGVVSLSTGGMHAAALTKDNQILTWGDNDEHQLGRETKGGERLVAIDEGGQTDDEDDDDDSGVNPEESTPTALPHSLFPDGTSFVQVVASDTTTFALTADGSVYGWGCFRNNEGIFGFRDGIQEQTTPYKYPELKKITQLACGDAHVLALDEKGNVYGWGAGQQNQLGRRIVERTSKGALVPRLLPLPKGQIKYVSSGSYHSFAIDKRDRVWTWGLNSMGQCGIKNKAGEDNSVLDKPTIVPSLSGVGIKQIEGGNAHSVALTESGKCMVWGRCDAGQLGIDYKSLATNDVVFGSTQALLPTPTAVPNVNAVCVTAGGESTAVVTSSGQAMGCGSSASYQHGQGAEDQVLLFTTIASKAIRDKTISWASIGGQCLVLAGPPTANSESS